MRLSKSIVPFRYDLELWVDLDSCQFKGILKAELQIVEPARYVCLNSADLSITSVVLQKNNKVLWPTRSVENSEDETLKLEFGDNLVLNPGDDASVTIEYYGNLNEKLDGFYKSLYRDENGAIKYMAVGVFEPADARRFFPCWDEPSFKARFKFKVHAPPDRVVLSNMPAIRETISDNIKIVEFEESIPMSTYIVTVVVGEFEYMEAATEDGTIVRVYARPGLLHKGKFALDLTLKLLPYFSKLFGTRYPLPKLDLVAVPTFKAGALENFGCVVYLEEALLLEDNSSASLRQQVALDTAHEIAHMWFGNLVTIEWWTHLWLNEGMATWMSYYAIDHIFPEWNIWLSFSEIKEAGQRLDALVSSHPVEVPVGNVKEAAGAFDSISYCKGASIVHMLQTYLGPADLQAALASYIRKFAFSNADSDDLWESFEQETGKPIKELMHSWTKQKGYPAIKATLMENDGVVQLEQYHFLANGSEGEGIWIVPVTFRKEGETESTALILKDEPVRVRIEPGRWIHFNPGQSGFYCVQYDSKLLELLEKSFPAALSPLDRLGILKDMLDLCRAGKQPMTELVHWLKLYENETHPAVISAIIDVSLSISGVFGVAMPELSDQVNQSLCKQLESFARSVGWEAVLGESHLASIVRGQIFNALVELHHRETCLRASEYFESRNVPPSLMKAVYKNAMAASASFDILVEIFRSSGSSEERSIILSSLAWTSDPEIICKALEFSISDEVNPQEIPTVFWGVKFEGWVTAWSWFKENWERVCQRLGQGFLLGRVVRALAHHIYSEAAVEEFEEVMLPRCQSKVLKSLNEALEGARLRVQWVTWVQLQAPQLVSSTF